MLESWIPWYYQNVLTSGPQTAGGPQNGGFLCYGIVLDHNVILVPVNDRYWLISIEEFISID